MWSVRCCGVSLVELRNHSPPNSSVDFSGQNDVTCYRFFPSGYLVVGGPPKSLIFLNPRTEA